MLRSLFVAAFVLCPVACSRTSETPPVKTDPDAPPPVALTPPKKTVPAADVKKLADDNTAFAFDLYARLNDRPQLFISPYSISTALAMLYTGARGATADEIAKTCHFGRSPQELADVYANLIWNQRGQRQAASAEAPQKKGKLPPFKQEYDWREANALWVQRRAALHAEYLDLLKQGYAADARPADFADPAASAAIARWIAQQTANKIKDLRIKTSGDTRLVLVNAVYFKADWWTPFLPQRTFDDTFQLSDKERAPVKMMSGDPGRYQYVDQGAFEMLALPYRGDASMLVLLPKKVGLAELDPLLTADNLKTWVAKMHSQAARVYLPKFELRQELKLNDVLQALGMKQAFGGSADFSGISSEPLFVNQVIHATYVKVDEQGTEAAATTAVEMKKESAPDKDRLIDFRVNRPFVFLIRDEITGSVLFLGRVTDPRKGS